MDDISPHEHKYLQIERIIVVIVELLTFLLSSLTHHVLKKFWNIFLSVPLESDH
jgi:hypothetical protein